MASDRKIPHGTSNGYKNYGCRCDKCRKANTRYTKKWMDAHPDQKAKRRVSPELLKNHPAVHGEQSGINKHKRDKTTLCRPCKVTWRAQRLAIIAKREATLKPHGTETALRRHYRRHEKPCRLCKNVYKNRKAEQEIEHRHPVTGELEYR